MRKWLKKHDIITKAISLFSAVLLWMYVMNTENPDKTQTYNGLGITITGQENILNAYNLSIINGADTTVDLKIDGKQDDISKLTRSQIKIKVDVSDIKQSGTYSVPYEIQLPNGSLSIKSKVPDTIQLDIDKIISTSIPVTVVTTGNPASDYKYGDVECSNRTVTISGPETDIKTVKKAQVTINADKLTETLKSSYEYVLLGNDGEEIRSPNISKNINSVMVTIPVYKYKSLPLEATILSSTIDKSRINLTMTPSHIKVYGDPKIIDGLNSIVVTTLRDEHLVNGNVVNFGIKLPSGVKEDLGQTLSGSIKIEIEQPTTKAFDVSNINIVDASESTTKQISTSVTSVNVMLQGYNLETIKPEHITITVNADVENLPLGENTLNANIEVTSDQEVTVIGTYTVNVVVEEK